jgi:peptidyl-prolyl cis-trans isomerase D
MHSMLQTIREHTQGLIAGTVISLVILTFALWGIHSYFVSGQNNNVVATVNGIEITKEQAATAYERLRRQIQMQYGMPVTSQDESVLKNKALQGIITVDVLKQASLKQGFRVGDEQIDDYLENMPEFQVDGQFSMDRFQEVMASTALSTSDFLELIRTSLLIDQPRLGIELTAFALPHEAEEAIALVNEERFVNYLMLPYALVLKSIQISPREVQAYYASHQTDFMTPEQVNVEYLLLSVKQLEESVHPSPSVLQRFYSDNINAYTEPTRWKLAMMTFPKTQDGQSKADALVRSLKEKRDGEVHDFHPVGKGFLTLNQVPAALQQTVAEMTRLHEVSDPVETKDSWVVLQVAGYEAPKAQSFETVKKKVEVAYIKQTAEEQFAALRDQLADVAYEHPDSLSPAAKALHLPVLSSALFAKDKTGPGITQYKKVREMAFSNDVLNLQNNSDVIQLDPETVLVLRIKSHVPSSLLPLQEVAQQINDKLRMERAEQQVMQLATARSDQLQKGADPLQVATRLHSTWTAPNWMGRYATKVDPAILNAAFQLPALKEEDKKIFYGTVRLPHGYAIVALHAVKTGQPKGDKQPALFREQAEQTEGALEYALYKKSQIQNAKIVMSGK